LIVGFVCVHPRFLAPLQGAGDVCGAGTGGVRFARPPANFCHPYRGRSCRGRSCRDRTCRDRSCRGRACRGRACRGRSCRDRACRGRACRDRACRSRACWGRACWDRTVGVRDGGCGRGRRRFRRLTPQGAIFHLPLVAACPGLRCRLTSLDTEFRHVDGFNDHSPRHSPPHSACSVRRSRRPSTPVGVGEMSRRLSEATPPVARPQQGAATRMGCVNAWVCNRRWLG